VKLLLGNKCESNRKIVDADTAEKFAREHGLRFLEVSAKTGLNLEQAFNCFTDLLMENGDKAMTVRAEEDDRVQMRREETAGRTFRCCPS